MMIQMCFDLRANLWKQQNEYAQALTDFRLSAKAYDTFLETNQLRGYNPTDVNIAYVLAHLGETAEVLKIAREIRGELQGSPPKLFRLAKALALCCPSDDASAEPPNTFMANALSSVNRSSTTSARPVLLI